MTAKQIKEQEAEDALERQRADFAREDEEARERRARAREKFLADIAACRETNS